MMVRASFSMVWGDDERRPRPGVKFWGNRWLDAAGAVRLMTLRRSGIWAKAPSGTVLSFCCRGVLCRSPVAWALTARRPIAPSVQPRFSGDGQAVWAGRGPQTD